jgi:predicted TIM-barrel fold metal-dependent hydrolase
MAIPLPERIDFHVNLLPSFALDNVNSAAIPEESEHLKHCFDLPVTASLNARCTAPEIISAMDAAGVARSVVFSYQWRDAARCALANATVVNAVQAHSARFHGLAVVQPLSPESVDELEVVLSKPGMIGVKMKPRWGGFALSDLATMGPICELLVSRNGLLLTHVSQSFLPPTGDQLNDLFALAKAFPQLKIVAAHMGAFAGVYECYEPFQRHVDNLWIDISLPANLRWLPHLMRLGDPRRYLYATDWPYVQYDTFDQLLADSELTENEMHQLCVGNPAQLLDAVKS